MSLAAWQQLRRRWAPLFLLVVVGICLATVASAHDLNHPERASSDELWGPLISQLGPHSFSLHFGISDGKARPATLHVDEAGQRRPLDGLALRTVQSEAAVWHTLVVDGLSSGRRYRYQLSVDGLTAQAGEVTTAPPDGDPRPLLLAVFGDEQASPNNDSVSSRSIVQSVLAEAPDLVIGTGDLVGEGGSQADWRELSKTHTPLWSQLLYVPALGNHELLGDPSGRFFRQLLPQAAARFYTLRFGFLQLIVLDGNRPGLAEQTQFLANELRKSDGDPLVRARLVVIHQPPLSSGLHCGTAGSMAAWMQLFERHHVDAVLTGHDHAYERLERNGVPYFVSGGGGAKLYDLAPCGEPDEPALQKYQSVHHYLMVELRPQPDRVVISVRAQVPQGLPFDRVTLPLASSRIGTLTLDSDKQGPPRRWHRGYLRHILRHHGLQLVLAIGMGGVAVLAWRYGRRRSS